ncbi:MAG: VWA domain-containing protein [Saprospiraceae bacterium]|nr:VWA domain-containing protein [Saprospiraceae bacterium]
MGKILNRIVLLFAVLMLWNQSQAQPERVLPNCPMHVVIALDFSASERAFIDEIQTVLLALTSRFELHPNSLRIGLVSFNRGAQVILPLTGSTDSLELAINALRIPMNVYATDIHAGIELGYDIFRRHSLESVPKFFVLVSDGDPHAHGRGFGFRQDLIQAEKLRNGDLTGKVDPVHVFSIYSGRVTPYRDPIREDVRIASILHLQALSSGEGSFFYFEDYPELVNLLEQLSSCL